MKHKRIIILALTITLLLTGCGSVITPEQTDPPETTQAERPTIPGITIPIEPVSTESPTEQTTTQAPTSPSNTSEDKNGCGGYPWKKAELSEKLKNADPSKVIALTFDDGPSTNYPSSTERILDVLEEYGCKATFFVQGINLEYAEFKERNTALVKREADMGMEIGSHSYNHPYFNKISGDEIKKQLVDSIKLIEEATGGYKVRIMRCPGGAEKQSVKDAVEMPMISWDIDTRDWDTKNADSTYNKIMENVKGGSVILMHDLYNATADAVERVVPELVSRGYILVTISELFTIYGQTLEPHTVYYNAR